MTFLFVHRDFKFSGHGRRLLEFVEIEAWNEVNERPIRTDAARKAVGFFEKCGYKQLDGQPRESCAGSSLFRFLYFLEKEWPHAIEESWD